MSDNPFEAPGTNQNYDFQPGPGGKTGRGYVQQVPVIASLFIVQGILLFLFGLLGTGYAFFFTQMPEFMPPPNQQNAQMQAQLEQQTFIAGLVFAVLAAGVFLLGGMHFVAAFLGFKFKYRYFGIVTMILGLGSMFTCYCAPTAIGLAIYGMIIYFHPAVAQAFEMGKSGLKHQQILDQFP